MPRKGYPREFEKDLMPSSGVFETETLADGSIRTTINVQKPSKIASRHFFHATH